MRFPTTFAACLVLLLLTSCKTGTVRDDVPALIVDPTTASRAELRRAVADALNIGEVTIADDALTRDSVLIIEPARLMGRDFRRPEHFRLVLSGSTCALVHQESGRRYELAATTCRAEGS